MDCPICQRVRQMKPILQFNPKNSSISGTNEISFSLEFCHDCHHFYNSSFEIEKIDYSNVEFETFFNHCDFKKSIQSSIQMLANFFDSRDVSFFDFGCGDGDYLEMVKAHFLEQNVNVQTLGYEVGKFSNAEGVITNSKLDFKSAVSNAKNPVLVARHVLEHLDKFDEFFSIVPKKNCLIYIEVPNGAQAIIQKRFEDLVYEHVSYFSFKSLIKLIEKYNLTLLSSFVGLNGDNIGIICKTRGEYENNVRIKLHTNYTKQISKYEDLEKVLKKKSTAFWGIGGRCRTILNSVGSIAESKLDCILLDSDPDKVGSEIYGFKNRSQLPTFEILEDIQLVVIGSRVGKGSIMQELGALDYNRQAVLWDEVTSI